MTPLLPNYIFVNLIFNLYVPREMLSCSFSVIFVAFLWVTEHFHAHIPIFIFTITFLSNKEEEEAKSDRRETLPKLPS